MAFGPDTVIQKDKPVSFSETPQNDPNTIDEDEDEDNRPQYRFYESTQILGKLFRRINERDVFQNIQQRIKPLTKSKESVIQAIWNYVVDFSPSIDWSPHMARARGIRDE